MGSITIRIDDEMKAQAEAELTNLDMTHTDVIHGLYKFIIRYKRVPFSSDEHALTLMQERLAVVSDIASNMNLIIETKNEFSTAEIKSFIALLDRFTTELESNWTAMKRASGKNFSSYWLDALQSAKGVSYFLSMTGKRRGHILTFSETGEIKIAISRLVQAYVQLLSPDNNH